MSTNEGGESHLQGIHQQSWHISPGSPESEVSEESEASEASVDSGGAVELSGSVDSTGGVDPGVAGGSVIGGSVAGGSVTIGGSGGSGSMGNSTGKSPAFESGFSSAAVVTAAIPAIARVNMIKTIFFITYPLIQRLNAPAFVSAGLHSEKEA